MERHRIIFFLCGKEILTISANDMFPGELESTIGLLAYENGVTESEIYFAEKGCA